MTMGAMILIAIPSEARAALSLQGDANGDGVVNGKDITGFVAAFVGIDSDPCLNVNADVNLNDTVESADVELFVQFLLGTAEPGRYVELPRRLRIGPIAGLTTDWHTAPTMTSVPLGTMVQLELTEILPSDAVNWIGAVEIERTDTYSRAECPVTQLSPHTIQVVVNSGLPCEWQTICQFDAVDVAVDDITCSVDVSVPPLSVDENSDNATTLMHFFSSESIAQLKTLGQNHYQTSVKRRLTFSATTEPAGFEPLMEWRLDGTALGLGGTLPSYTIFSPDNYTFEVGALAQPEQIQIDTYEVIITSHTSGMDLVPEGESVTFIATTNPPGYENDVTWLSSTLYGSASPVLGQGPTFTVQFNGTWASVPGGLWQWMGIKADNVGFEQDQEPLNCPPCPCEEKPKGTACTCSGGQHCGGQNTTGNPVYLFSGENTETAVDLHIKGRGLDFVWSRKYRSRFGMDTVQGNGWDFSYNIFGERTGNNILLCEGNARRDLYLPRPDGTLAVREFFRQIEENTDGSCTLTFEDTGTWKFRPFDDPNAPGKVETITDRNGNTLTLDYDAQDRLVAIHDTLDNPPTNPRVINIAYNTNGFIESVTDFIGRQVRYEYYGMGTLDDWSLKITGDDGGGPMVFDYDVPIVSSVGLPGTSSPAEHTFMVPDNGTILDIDVGALVTHSRIGETRIELSHLGTTVILWEQQCDTNDDLDAVFDDEGVAAVCASPVQGMIIPFEALTAFDGMEMQGEWTIRVSEVVGQGSFGDLRSVTTPVVNGTPNGNDFPDGKTTIYTYSTGFADERLNHNLLTITDPKGQLYLSNVYGDSGPGFDRVIRQIWGNPGDLADYVYVPLIPSENDGAVSKVIVNDRVGNVKEHFIDQFNRTVRTLEYTGRAPDPDQPTTETDNRPTGKLRPDDDPDVFETRWEYNDDSLPTRIIHPNGNEELFIYDDGNPSPRSRGNLLQHCRSPGTHTPPGDQTQICESFEYDDEFGGCCGTNFVTRHTDGRGNDTVHQYDPSGNRIRTTHRITSIVEDFEYNTFGQLIARVLPDNGDPSGHRRRDEFTYYTAAEGFQFGYRKHQIIDAPNLALTTTFEYDPVGNMTRTIDPEGHDMQYEYNELDQVVRSLSAKVTPGSGVRYERLTWYDANDNVIREDIENKDDAGILQPNTHFSTIYEYEILNFRTMTCEEVGSVLLNSFDLDCSVLPLSESIKTEFQYDENRNRTLVRFGEATNGNQPTNAVQTLYDERDLTFREIRAPSDPDQSTTQFDYDSNQNLVTTRQGLENTGAVRIAKHTYDGYNRLVGSTDPMGNTTAHNYDENHNPVSGRTDGELCDVPGGASNVRLSDMSYVYDAMDRVTREIVEFFDTDTQNPINAGTPSDDKVTTVTVWSDNSQVLSIIDDNGHITRTSYDTANRVDTVTDAEDNTVTYTYDDDSLVVAITEVERSQLVPQPPDEVFTTTNAYDGLHRLTGTTDNVNNTHTFGYDSRNNRTVMTDALDNETRYVYDGINRLIRTIRDLDDDGADGDGDDITTAQSWDDTSRLVGQTDDADNTTTSVFDALNRKTAEIMADCTQHSFSFDVHDNRLIMTDANGSVATCTYDLLNRLTTKSITVGPGVSTDTTAETYKYDGLSRLVLAEDNDSRVTRNYDSLSQVTRETLTIARGQPDETSGTTICRYDGVGNDLETTYPGGRFITCTYDKLDRKSVITDETGGGSQLIAEYSYVGPGRVERRDYGNGTRCDYTYDGITGIANPTNDFGVKQIISTTHSVIAGGATIDARTYTWDKMYNKTQRMDVRAGGPELTHDYQYDDIYRLTRTVVTDPTPTTLRETDYELDGVGNRLAVSGDPDPGIYTLFGDLCAGPADEDMNQYTTTSIDEREYDENGNLIQRNQPGGAPGVASISYDYRNQMVEYNDLSLGQRHIYAYDPFGRRIARVVDADGVASGPTETRYFYDDWQVCEEQGDTGSTAATYVYGFYIDEVLNMRRGGSDFFYHTDDLYNVMAVTNTVGAVAERYEYQDYGVPEFVDAMSVPISQSAIANPYMFTGRRFDFETGWHSYRTRYLDPVVGRFTTRDTIGIWEDSRNLGNGYTYVASNPSSRLDPSGHGETNNPVEAYANAVNATNAAAAAVARAEEAVITGDPNADIAILEAEIAVLEAEIAVLEVQIAIIETRTALGNNVQMSMGGVGTWILQLMRAMMVTAALSGNPQNPDLDTGPEPSKTKKKTKKKRRGKGGGKKYKVGPEKPKCPNPKNPPAKFKPKKKPPPGKWERFKGGVKKLGRGIKGAGKSILRIPGILLVDPRFSLPESQGGWAPDPPGSSGST